MISLYYRYIEITVGLNFGIKHACAAMCVLCIISVRLCEAKTIALTKRLEWNPNAGVGGRFRLLLAEQ